MRLQAVATGCAGPPPEARTASQNRFPTKMKPLCRPTPAAKYDQEGEKSADILSLISCEAVKPSQGELPPDFETPPRTNLGYK